MSRLACVFATVITIFATFAHAHPMGNFSVSHNTSFEIERNWFRIALRIDIAEIPSVEEMKLLDANHDGQISESEKAAYLKDRVLGLTRMQTLRLNGKSVEPLVLRTDVITSEGAGGLPCIFLVVDYRVDFPAANQPATIEYEDHSFEGRTGWREITARAGAGMKIIESNVPERDLSRGLSVYPTDMAKATPQVSSARIVFQRRDGATTSMVAEAKHAAPVATPVRRDDPLAKLFDGGKASTTIILLSLPLAFALGAFHALSPGHGKTVVAAYLVGSRGTAWHAFLLGIVVTLTHTAGVFALGLIVLFASSRLIPEQLYPWLGFASGMMIFAVGSWQLVRRWAAVYSANVALEHNHGPGGHSHLMPESFSLAGLVALGVSGGIVPCPSALIVMLSAIAMHRSGAGLVLIVIFSIGLASVLILIGMIAVYSQRVLQRWSFEATLAPKLRFASSLVVSLLGLGIAFQALRAGAVL